MGRICSPGHHSVRFTSLWSISYLQCINSYLQNGNILAARTFITHFTSALPKDLQISSVAVGSSDEIILTKDRVVNFTQIAVLTCQRAQGEKSKVMRESWIRLCGTYQSRGGVLATAEVRKVNIYCYSRFLGSQFLPPQKALNELATLYFSIPPPRNQAANPFGDMMSSLFGGPAQPQAPRRLQPMSSSSPGLD
jgi:hypothetical protein